MKKKNIVFVMIVLLAVMGIALKYHTPPAQTPTNTAWVKTAKVQQGIVPLEVHAMGSLTARSVEITPEVAGHVREIFFADGRFVKQNTPLIQLDDAIYKAKYESAKAQLDYSQNDYHRKNLLGKQGVITKQAIGIKNVFTRYFQLEKFEIIYNFARINLSR